MHNSYCYSTKPDDDDTATMPSLAFEFIPPDPGLSDNFGVTSATPKPGGSKQDLSIRIAEKVAQIEDLDTKLQNDPQLNNQMRKRTKNLLTEIGYAASLFDLTP